ncbi:MAG: ABC transporter permease [Acidimicrobiales bacterium]|nr:ABC transporter permease [Acidimicrobiales bacterium]
MNEFIGFTVSGLVSAGLYAIVACGLTLTYTTTGIFNWAHGALVAVGAFSYWQFAVDWGLPTPLAAAICLLLVGPLMGVTLEAVIMHRLEGTSEATRMVVTLALLLGVLAGMNWIWPPSQQRLVPRIAGGHVLTVLGQRVPYSDILVIATGLLVAVGLRTLLYRTRAGVEMRATVDDRTLATLNGASPSRTAMRSWAIGSTLAVLAGILIAPRGALSATTLALLIVNAYAAAVIGRLRSLPMTFVGAVILGLATGYAQGYVGSRQDITGYQYLVGLVNVLPVVVLFVALQFLPQSRLRGARVLRVKEVSSRPTWPGTLVLAVSVVIVAVAVAPLLSPGDLNSVTKVWGLAIVALSLVPLVGYGGRLSVCPLSFAAIGAVVVSHLGGSGNPVVIIWAVLIAAACGAVLSLTVIRLSGLYLSLATAAFAVMLDNWILTLPKFTAVIRVPFTDVTLYRHEITIFEGGSLDVRRPSFFGVHTTGDHAFFIYGAVVFALVTLVVAAVRRSDFGLRLIALKDSPVGYATLGLNGRLTSMAVFAFSAGLAGLGGAVYGAAIQRPSPNVFSFFSGLSILLAVVILGVNSIGAAAAAGVFVGGPALTNLFPGLAQLSSTLIGTAGIGLGDNPNGAVPAEMRPRWRPVPRAPVVLVGGLAAVVITYFLTLAGVLGNWTFATVLVVVLLAMPPVARYVAEIPAPRPVRDAEADGLSGPPELLGLTLPVTSADLDRVSREISVPRPRPTGGSHGT